MIDQLRLWLDFETTDLDTRDTVVLEAAGFMTTSDLHVLRGTEFHFLGDFTPDAVRHMRDTAVDVVREMHDKNGLWEALLGRTEVGLDRLNLATMEKRLVSMVQWAGNQQPTEIMWPSERTVMVRPEGGYEKKPRLAGSGVAAFDVQIIRFQMPALAASLDYTSTDVSNIRRFLTDECCYELDLSENRPHRAHEDILHAWEEAIYIRNQMGALNLPLSRPFADICAADGEMIYPEF